MFHAMNEELLAWQVKNRPAWPSIPTQTERVLGKWC